MVRRDRATGAGSTDALPPAVPKVSGRVTALDEHGFMVMPGPVPPARMPRLSDAYDAAMAAA